jgi:hypothetical protein
MLPIFQCWGRFCGIDSQTGKKFGLAQGALGKPAGGIRSYRLLARLVLAIPGATQCSSEMEPLLLSYLH